MHFQVRTDNHITNSEALTERLRSEVAGTLETLHADQLRRVEIYLQDMNAHKGGTDIRCAVEVHLAGYPAIAVSADATNVDDAVTAALERVASTIEHKLGRLRDRGGRVSMSGEET